MVITNMSIFLQRSIYCKEGGGELFLSDGGGDDGGGDPLKALLEGALAQQAACHFKVSQGVTFNDHFTTGQWWRIAELLVILFRTFLLKCK
jgi:hypothetical protein